MSRAAGTGLSGKGVTMPEKYWIEPVKARCTDLFCTLLREFAGKGEISLEGYIRRGTLSRLPGASTRPTEALRKQVVFAIPWTRFVVIPLSDHNVTVLTRLVTACDDWADIILQLQIATAGGLVFGAYDNFHEECVVAYREFPTDLLDRFVADGIIGGYRKVPESEHRWHD